MSAIQRLCGIGFREDQPNRGNEKIGFIDLQSWAVAKGLTWRGHPDHNTRRTQKHPPSLIQMVAYGMTGVMADMPKMTPVFDTKRRKLEFDSLAEAAKVFLQKLSPVKEEYTIMDPAYTLYVAYTFLMTSTRDNTTPMLHPIRDDLVIRFFEPLLPEENLSGRCPDEAWGSKTGSNKFSLMGCPSVSTSGRPSQMRVSRSTSTVGQASWVASARLLMK